MADTTNHIKTILEADPGNYERVMSRAAKTAERMESTVGGRIKGFAGNFKSSFGNAAKATGNFIQSMAPVASKVGNVMAVSSAAVLAGTGVMAKAFAGFAVDSLKSAADMQALQSQYNQVFAGMEKQANSSINSIAKDTNILPQRLKPAFTSMAAFAKTAGFDTKDALDLTSRATKAAADSAAYYDRSLSDVTESLQSYLKGNYENDAALGLSSTETTRNAAANKLYGKSFNDLSEAQKQLTLLQMVEDANKLSGALGQASREGNGWENVMGNIQAGIDGFKAAVAGPFLQPLMNALGKLTPLFGVVQGKIEAFFKTAKGQEVIKQFSDTVAQLADKFVAFVTNIDIGAIADQIGKFVNSFTNGDLPGTIATIATKIGELVGWLIQFIPKAVEMAPTILALAAGFKALSVISTIISIVSALMPVLTAIGGAIMTVVGVLGGPLTVAIAAVIAAGIALYKNWDTVVQWAGKLWQGIKEAWDSVVEATVELAGNVAKWWDNLKTSVVEKVSSIYNSVTKWWSDLKVAVVKFIVQLLVAAVDKFTEIKNSVVKTVSGMVNSVIKFFSNLINGIVRAVSNIYSNTVNKFNQLKSTVVSTVSNLVSSGVRTFQNFVRGVGSVMRNIGTAISNGFVNAYNKVIGWGKTFFNAGANIVNMIAGGIKSAIGAVTDAIGNITQKIRNFLPFSPAKEGPLRDLNKLNFGGTISQGIYNGKRQVATAMDDILGIPDLTEPNLAFGNGSGVNYKYTTGIDNRLRVDLYSVMEVDGREVARTTEKDMTEEQSRRTRTETRAMGYR